MLSSDPLELPVTELIGELNCKKARIRIMDPYSGGVSSGRSAAPDAQTVARNAEARSRAAASGNLGTPLSCNPRNMAASACIPRFNTLRPHHRLLDLRRLPPPLLRTICQLPTHLECTHNFRIPHALRTGLMALSLPLNLNHFFCNVIIIINMCALLFKRTGVQPRGVQYMNLPQV